MVSHGITGLNTLFDFCSCDSNDDKVYKGFPSLVSVWERIQERRAKELDVVKRVVI